MSDENNNKNPFQYFWDMATGGLFSDGSDQELTPDKSAGKKRKKASAKHKLKRKTSSKHSHIDSANHKKAG
jgi:hypothetical protein